MIANAVGVEATGERQDALSVAMAIAIGKLTPEAEAWLATEHSPAGIAASPVVRHLAEIHADAKRSILAMNWIGTRRLEKVRDRLADATCIDCDPATAKGFAYQLVQACEGRGCPTELAEAANLIERAIARSSS